MRVTVLAYGKIREFVGLPQMEITVGSLPCFLYSETGSRNADERTGFRNCEWVFRRGNSAWTYYEIISPQGEIRVFNELDQKLFARIAAARSWTDWDVKSKK